jgi:nucleoside-diphosphate-sugar epimerase
MKVLLTGANGFVGSHILECLHAAGLSTRILLRKTSDTRFINSCIEGAKSPEPLPPSAGEPPDLVAAELSAQQLRAARAHSIEIQYGSISVRDSLAGAMQDVDCVIHCAGKTKVLETAEFYEANHVGTRNVVAAASAAKVKQFIHISSLAAFGPAGTESPASENQTPHPVSEYGKSKLLGEQEVAKSNLPFTILRPSAVYGPRDVDFLHTFRSVRNHVLPLFRGGRMTISMVYVRDLAQMICACVGNEITLGQTYFVAHPVPASTRNLLEEMARQMSAWTVPLHLPAMALYPICLGAELISRARRRPSILNRGKIPEILAPGWVCSVEKLHRDLNFVAPTDLRAGISETLNWYRMNGWI